MNGTVGESRGRRRLRLFVSRAMALVALSACAPSASPPNEASPRGPAPRDAVPTVASYTAEQANAGERVFTTVCATCHGRNEFVGPIFAMTWMAEPVGNLFEHISTAMPQDRPGSLTAEEYASVVAYLLRLNGRPPGERALPADPEALARVTW